jgi:hypothetical protein
MSIASHFFSSLCFTIIFTQGTKLSLLDSKYKISSQFSHNWICNHVHELGRFSSIHIMCALHNAKSCNDLPLKCFVRKLPVILKTVQSCFHSYFTSSLCFLHHCHSSHLAIHHRHWNIITHLPTRALSNKSSPLLKPQAHCSSEDRSMI